MSDDTVSGELIDLRGLTLIELRDELDDAEIDTALKSVLSDQGRVANNGFNNYI